MAETTKKTRIPLRQRLRRVPRWAWIAGVVGVLAAVLLLLILLRRPTVTLGPVIQGEALSAVYAPGTVLSSTETVVAASASGRIVARYVNRGSRVTPGMVVAQLDDTQARLQLQQTQRQLATARSQYAQVAERGDVYDVQQARAQLAQAQAQYSQALDAVNAARAGIRSARAQREQATAAVRTAQARVRTARRSVDVAQQQRDTASAKVASAKAQLAIAQSQLDDARDNLRRLEALFSQKAIAEREVIRARTLVRVAESTVVQRQSDVETAQQGLEQAEASIAVAQGQVEEAQSAVEQSLAAIGQADAAISTTEAQLAQAQAQVRAAREGITAAQARLSSVQRGSRPSAVEVARAQVRTAEAAVAQAQDALSKYTVKSLVNGTVSETPVEVGDFVNQGAPVANVVSPGSLYVQANVDETDIGPVAIGQAACFTTDTVPNATFQGIVTEVGASADVTTNTYPVEIRNIPDTAGLRVNLSVDVNIVTRVDPNALLVPASAVVTTPAPHVWMVDARQRLVQRPVTLGARDYVSGRVEITKGLTLGEYVVRTPKPNFKTGQQVRVASER